MNKNEDDKLVRETQRHPSKNLAPRRRGYGIGGGYEKPRKARDPVRADSSAEHNYGAISHGGYFGSGDASRRFAVGQATFEDELAWYKAQFGEETTSYTDGK